MTWPTETDLAKLRYENAHAALALRARRAEARVAEAKDIITRLEAKIAQLEAQLRKNQP